LGSVPPEVWNRLGTKIIPKLRAGSELKIGLEFAVTVSMDSATGLATELRQILQELGLAEAVKIE
jgi:thiamine monophosphate kinase